eukprot:m.135784 g.135784  ORF g.135784 m.135784 type:complete len:891 (-) comp13126_c0_seq1:26-2698(-)
MMWSETPFPPYYEEGGDGFVGGNNMDEMGDEYDPSFFQPTHYYPDFSQPSVHYQQQYEQSQQYPNMQYPQYGNDGGGMMDYHEPYYDPHPTFTLQRTRRQKSKRSHKNRKNYKPSRNHTNKTNDDGEDHRDIEADRRGRGGRRDGEEESSMYRDLPSMGYILSSGLDDIKGASRAMSNRGSLKRKKHKTEGRRPHKERHSRASVAPLEAKMREKTREKTKERKRNRTSKYNDVLTNKHKQYDRPRRSTSPMEKNSSKAVPNRRLSTPEHRRKSSSHDSTEHTSPLKAASREERRRSRQLESISEETDKGHNKRTASSLPGKETPMEQKNKTKRKSQMVNEVQQMEEEHNQQQQKSLRNVWMDESIDNDDDEDGEAMMNTSNDKAFILKKTSEHERPSRSSWLPDTPTNSNDDSNISNSTAYPSKKSIYSHPPPNHTKSYTLSATFKRRMSKAREKFIYEEKAHRPFFTYWLVIVELLTVICLLSFHGYSPLDFKAEVKTSLPLLQPDGSYRTFTYKSFSNFWFGPSHETLALVGAKYSPCMQQDDYIQSTFIQPQLTAEESYGCCVNSNVCFSSSENDCPYTFVADEMCGGPSCCETPEAFPGCTYRDTFSASERQCTCAIQSRPCCYGMAGQCSLLTEDSCTSDVIKGTFHADKVTCAEVNCLQEECGMSPFLRNTPDQWYRLFSAIFLHAGLIHFIVVVLLQVAIIPDVERVAGWWRVGLIFFSSAVGGFVVSGLFSRYQVTVGGSGGTIGIVGALMVELIQSWRLIDYPMSELAKLSILLIFTLLIGLLPYIDNYSHIGGFVFGAVTAIAVLPYVTLSTTRRFSRRTVGFIAFGVVVTLFVLSFTIFFAATVPNCTNCGALNCVDIVDGFCADHGQDSSEPIALDLG